MSAARRNIGTTRQVRRDSLAGDLQAVATARLSEMRDIWSERLGEAPAAPKPAHAPMRLSSGAKLIRNWKGVPHEVWVIAGGYMHQGQTYKSLSEVARAITGTRWNGPLFFGLRDKSKEAA